MLQRLTSPSEYLSRPTTGAEQGWVRWLQCLIRKWSCVNHQFQFHTQIAYKSKYMTHDLYYLLLYNYWPDIKYNYTNLAFHSLGHSRGPLTSASDYASAQWRLILHILVTRSPHVNKTGSRVPYMVFVVAEVIDHNHSTRAGPVRIQCVMTGMFDRKWKDHTSVPKHWEFFKWT